MTLSSFRSLSIGDTVHAGVIGIAPVTNVFFRELDGRVVSHVTVEGLGEIDETFAGLLETGVGSPVH